jgi:hypothetical protein
MMTLGESPHLEDNNVSERCLVIPGQYDIGKWFRSTDMAFHLKKNYDQFKIEKDEVMFYVRFHTKEKINFKQFRFTETLSDYVKDGFKLNFFRSMKFLPAYYAAFKNKKLILKEINENLI